LSPLNKEKQKAALLIFKSATARKNLENKFSMPAIKKKGIPLI
jgi:hypothetical protein